MQLLYGNDGINYRTIDKSPEMSEGIKKSLLGTYSKYEFVTKTKAYSSVENEPEAITYVTSNLDNQLSSDQLVVCKTGHMRQFSSPSYFFHGLVKEISNDYYKEDFFEIFNFEFISDVDISQYRDGSVDQYRFNADVSDTVALKDEQLIVIIASFMSNEGKGQKTKILVDAVGDDYNRRSREILASIYRYLPYELRRRHGFKTYSQDDRNLPARVSFVLCNCDEIKDDSGCIRLEEKVSDIEHTVEKQYIDYAAYLVEGLDAQGRKKHFDALSKLSKNGRLSISDCITYYTNLKEWSAGTQESLLPDWIRYVDQNSFRKGPLYDLMLEIIAAKVDNQYYNDYLFNNIFKVYKETIYQLSPLAAKTIRFADCLEELSISQERFHEWYCSQLKEKMDGVNVADAASAVKVKKIYDTEIAALQSVNIMSGELDRLLQKEIEYLTNERDRNSDKLDELRDNELTQLSEQISGLGRVSMEEFAEKVLSLQNSIQFEENRGNLHPTVEEWLDKYFQENFTNRKILKKYICDFQKLEDSISPQKFKDYKKVLEAERLRLEEEKKARIFKITKESVLKNYSELAVNLDRGILEAEDKVEIRISNKKTHIRVSDLNNLLEFILLPNDMNGERIQHYMKLLMEGRLLNVEHLRYLMKNAYPDEEDIRNIIEYYLGKDTLVKVSGKYVAKLIIRYQPDMAKYVERIYEDAEEDEAYYLSENLHQMIRLSTKNVQKSKHSSSDETSGKPKPEKKRGFGDFFGGRK